ncbi:MAG: questin oxidase family protein [Rhizobiales bacterium]|nr:questin oxidase family protein [Hyphomicrobiales bacterium]NRB15932.1 questin oxidase family protein [Hyphomicrobiales bacterium]
MLIDKINAYTGLKPDYDNQLSNHLPMTAFALAELGASDDHINKYFSSYLGRLEQAPQHQLVIDHNNWQQHLGENIYYTNYLTYFLERFENATTEQVLKDLLPVFIKSPASKAYHCLLRLAYGIVSKNKVEMAAGLAYWADSYLVIDQQGNEFDDKAKDDISENIFDDIRNTCIQTGYLAPDAPNIFSRIKAISQSELASLFISKAKISNTIGLDKIAVKCLELYLNTKNFTILHCVTSCHAQRIIFKFLTKKQQSEAILYYWQSVIFAYISINTPVINCITKMSFDNVLDVPEIKQTLITSFDDHDIKIAYTAIEEANFYKDDRFLKAAI